MGSKYTSTSPGLQAIDESPFDAHHFAMELVDISVADSRPRIVGSFGNLLDLQSSTATSVRASCDIVEIRLDLLGLLDDHNALPWSHLSDLPLLFTARREEEGGAVGLTPATRTELLRGCLDLAGWIDVEVASIQEMQEILGEITDRRIPWIASYHDFNQLPQTSDLERAAARAREAGASIFKAAAKLNSPADLARLAEFQLADHGIPVATMGMGALAPVSRLLCAQCGSRLNYGFLGNTATAPGQWDSSLLKTAISRLAPYSA